MQADLLALERRLSVQFADVLTDRIEELKRHFDAAVENIEDSLRGANADDLSSLHDRAHDHETRIAALEGKRVSAT